MGAITALRVAADRPNRVRGLVLEDPPLDVATVPLERRRDAMRHDLEAWSTLPADEREARAAAEHPTWHPLETGHWADAHARVDVQVADHLGLFDGFGWRVLFGRLAAPGLLVTGDPELGALVTDESATTALDLWRGGKRLHLPRAGHCIHRDRWDESMGAIRAFLTSVA
jgi:pimeloyl-ACP methyl ester carboxylesterase